MSFDRVLRLVEQLPDQSRFKSKLCGYRPFAQVEHLLADLFDIESISVWQRANANVKKSKQSPMPKPYPRPGMKQLDEKKEKDLRSMRARLLEQKERLGIKTSSG